MEVIGTALTTIGSTVLGAGAAGASSLGGAAAAGAGAAATGGSLLTSGALSLFQAGTSAFSILSSLSSANAQADNLRDQGFAAVLNAGETKLQSVEDQSDIKRELLATIGRRRVAYAASGIDVGFGAAVDAENRDATRADELIGRSETRATSALQNGLAVQQRAERMARRLKSNAILSAIGTGLGSGVDILRRGPSFGRAA